MKFARSIVGFTIAGMLVMSVWGDWVGKYGNLGGWMAACNHRSNVVPKSLYRTNRQRWRPCLC